MKDLIFTEFEVNKNSKVLGGPILNYHLGLGEFTYGSITSYGHAGFWGTDVHYFPSLNCSIAVFILESDESYKKKIIYEEILKELSEI